MPPDTVNVPIPAVSESAPALLNAPPSVVVAVLVTANVSPLPNEPVPLNVMLLPPFIVPLPPNVKLFNMVTAVLDCKLPPLNVNVSVAKLPNALLLPILNVPVLLNVVPPVNVLLPFNAQVPVPFNVSATVPPVAPFAIAPLITLVFALPSNCRVSATLAAPVNVVNVKPAVVGVNVVVPAAVKVVTPNATSGVPPETLPPAVIFNVFAPMFNVPNVCVIPAELAVALSDSIVVVPVTVVLYAFTDEFVARSSVPPAKVNAAPLAPNAAVLPATKVPDVNVVPPV